ncbi:hypothetical protein CSC19_4077 [Enterobacter hormaechei]|nr:hypothetical protein CSC19_4077 [Enterobacter hormaechei]
MMGILKARTFESFITSLIMSHRLLMYIKRYQLLNKSDMQQKEIKF